MPYPPEEMADYVNEMLIRPLFKQLEQKTEKR